MTPEQKQMAEQNKQDMKKILAESTHNLDKKLDAVLSTLAAQFFFILSIALYIMN